MALVFLPLPKERGNVRTRWCGLNDSGGRVAGLFFLWIWCVVVGCLGRCAINDSRDSSRSLKYRHWVTGGVLLHFGIAFICNMPPTALSAKLDDYYSWYLKGTGQWQDGWRMFERPSALNDYYEITVRDVRGARTTRVRGMRELNVIINSGAYNPELQDEVLKNYLWRKRKALSSDPEAEVELRRYTSTILLEQRVPQRQQLLDTWIMEDPGPR